MVKVTVHFWKREAAKIVKVRTINYTSAEGHVFLTLPEWVNCADNIPCSEPDEIIHDSIDDNAHAVGRQKQKSVGCIYEYH